MDIRRTRRIRDRIYVCAAFAHTKKEAQKEAARARRARYSSSIRVLKVGYRKDLPWSVWTIDDSLASSRDVHGAVRGIR